MVDKMKAISEGSRENVKVLSNAYPVKAALPFSSSKN
jgi:hypothetical protein